MTEPASHLVSTEPSPASAGQLLPDSTGESVVIAGDWTLPHYSHLRKAVARFHGATDRTRFDLNGLRHLDTAGASLLAPLLGSRRLAELTGSNALPPERVALLKAVATATGAAPPAAQSNRDLLELLARIGVAVQAYWRQLLQLLGFMGLSLATFVAVLPRPRRWRLNALVHQLEQTGLNAVPIVALLTFLVGAVVAFLGATVLAEFGATIYTVDLVAFAFMRELGVLLAAILLAGRTASAFTAQIGSMKANQEIDALRVQGLDPIELLVLPRILALMLTLPLLTFVAVLAGLSGGAAVAVFALDIPAVRFVEIVGEVPVQHFLIGLVKAPVFAALIALIGCLEGFKVSGSAESVGAHTTSSVVQSIFMVILLDAVAALFFMEMGW